MASWADLPPELLDLVVAGLPNPADRARSRAVCRSWHSAVRRHGPQAAQLPWTVFTDGEVVTPINGPSEHSTFIPKNSHLSGSADEWLLFGVYHRTPKLINNYVLHNIFSGERVSLTELDATLHCAYRVSKFRMQSTAHDFMAVITTNKNHPLIVILPGKSVWLPEPRAVPYVYIVDIAFCGHKLYGISKAEDLIPFDLGLDEEGRPVVTIARRVIQRPLDYDSWDDDYSDSDDDDGDGDDDNSEEGDDDEGDDDEDEEEVDIDVVANDEDEGEQKMEEEQAAVDKEYTCWHLVQSHGKLLMVKPHIHIFPDYSSSIRQVDVFIADVKTRKWVPMANGLGGDRALFIGQHFSKFVSAPCGDIKEDAIYFLESGEVFNMKTQSANPARFYEPDYLGSNVMWLFPPELVL
ncbi:unnamed protein product [Triticum turgidum subsp. durum]|uniref:F-box domain-containing protein n=1 Tax=Triticum turgidum subsp. durum TaxID=4567 RepID=A0A9R1AGK2_TRITD|nr:unnamed protein product [Triticum turgidum subsp. durum]